MNDKVEPGEVNVEIIGQFFETGQNLPPDKGGLRGVASSINGIDLDRATLIAVGYRPPTKELVDEINGLGHYEESQVCWDFLIYKPDEDFALSVPSVSDSLETFKHYIMPELHKLGRLQGGLVLDDRSWIATLTIGKAGGFAHDENDNPARALCLATLILMSNCSAQGQNKK